MHFLVNCLKPDAVLMLFVALMSLIGYGYPGYQARENQGLVWLLWLCLGILAVVAWITLVIAQ